MPKEKKLLLREKADGNGIELEAEQVSMEDLAQFAGFLLGVVGWEAYRRGMDMEEVKGNLLELYMAATELLEEWIQEGGGTDGEKKENDPGREKA